MKYSQVFHVLLIKDRNPKWNFHVLTFTSPHALKRWCDDCLDRTMAVTPGFPFLRL